MKSMILFSSVSTEAKDPSRVTFFRSTPNQISIWFIHDVCLGRWGVTGDPPGSFGGLVNLGKKKAAYLP